MDETATIFKRLRLPGMEQCWQSLIETRRVDGMCLRDGLQLLLQAESEQRKENRNARLLKQAGFRYQATIMETRFDASRGLDKSRVMELATCAYIRRGIPVVITGPAGTGKSWLATALGHQACMLGFKVRYYNVLKLFEQVTMARSRARSPGSSEAWPTPTSSSSMTSASARWTSSRCSTSSR